MKISYFPFLRPSMLKLPTIPKMFTRIRAKICICLLGLLVILSSWIAYRNIEEAKGFDQDNSPYAGPPIFFLSTNLDKSSSLSLRTACAVEAAAFHHPNSQITLYTTSSLPKEISDVISTIINVEIRLITAESALVDTPLHTWFKEGKYKTSEIGKIHVRDAILLSILSKNGGIYLANDVWCLRTLDKSNSVELRQEDSIDDGILIFEKWHRFLLLTVKEFADNYDKYIKKSIRFLMTNVIKTRCRVSDKELLSSKSSDHFWKCLYIKILPVDTLNPIHQDNWQVLFDKTSTDLLDTVYAIRLWNSLSKNTKSKPGSGIAIDYMARFNCPLAYRVMKGLNRI